MQHSRIDSASVAEDELISSLISAAASACETFTGRQLITATWDVWLDSWWEKGIYQDGALLIPYPPLQTITHVKYVDTEGTLQTWDPAERIEEIPTGEKAQKARIVPAYGIAWPSIRRQPKAVQIRFVAGYGASAASIPTALKQGMLLRFGEFYDRREESSLGVSVMPNLKAAEALWWPFRVAWF
jgi:uncharacterized phiE125 gp8 family phage protein